MLRGRIEFPRLGSELLEGNMLGDPAEREVLVYLPPGYVHSDKRYPVAYPLAAYAGSYRSFANFRMWEEGFFHRYERLLAGGEVPEVIFVAPDCMTRFGGSQYLDSTVCGPYQRYIVEEVVPFVDSRYRTLPKSSARAIFGHSSGGFGALRMGTDRPGHFGVYGSQAGDCDFEVSIRPSFTAAAIALHNAGGAAAFLEAFDENGGPRGAGDFEAIMTIATATAYAPSPGLPYPHAQLPFDLETAMPIAEAWERWKAHDPLDILRADGELLSDAKLVYIDAGDRDEHGLKIGAEKIAALLRERGTNLHYEVFKGGHRGTSHRFGVSLPIMLGALDKQ